MNDVQPRTEGMQANVRGQTVRLGCWTAAWLAAMALANLVGFNAEISHVMILTGLTYIGAVAALTAKMQ